MKLKVPYDKTPVTSNYEPMITKCCCCIPLKAGCYILGYLNLIFNTIHTLGILMITTFLGIYSHGFDHFDYDQQVVSRPVTEVESMQTPYLKQIGLLLMVILFGNVVWLIINVACLVGLHKRRPGPVKVYLGFAATRLLLSFAGYIYLMMTSFYNMQAVLSHSIDIALTSYFAVVYSVYSKQLMREQENEMPSEVTISDISINPPEVDKKILVS